MARKHYVEFESPGTLFAETSRRPVESWDIRAALELSRTIVERHGARPASFRFVTMLEHDPVDDGEGGKLDVEPREVARSGRHFIDGQVLSYDNVDDNKGNEVLRSNMRCNREPIVCETRNSWKSTQFFGECDAVVSSASGDVTRRGADPDLVDYRAAKVAEWDAADEAEMAKYRRRKEKG